jgi:biotin carboxyl carrier protein
MAEIYQVKIGTKDVLVNIEKFTPQGDFVCQINKQTIRGSFCKKTGSIKIMEQNDKQHAHSLVRYVSANPSDDGKEVHLELSQKSGQKSLSLKAQVQRHLPGAVGKKAGSEQKSAIVRSPMTGKILKVVVKDQDQVQKGDLLVVVEAMKMENKILAPMTGKVQKIKCKAGQLVNVSEELLRIGN